MQLEPNKNLKEFPFLTHTLGQKSTFYRFYPEITKNLMFEKCEFCEKISEFCEK